MSNRDSETAKVQSFATLKAYEQRAVILKAAGREHRQITEALKKEFGADIKAELGTVNQWFGTNGRLEQPLLEYNEALANESLKGARLQMKKVQKRAVERIVELMDQNEDRNVALGAAKEIIARHIPAKQVNIETKDDGEVPSDLVDQGNDAIQDNDTTLNDAPVGGEVNQENGSGPGENIPSSLLSEPSPSDPTGNTPA